MEFKFLVERMQSIQWTKTRSKSLLTLR
jgi:hypothetical protein